MPAPAPQEDHSGSRAGRRGRSGVQFLDALVDVIVGHGSRVYSTVRRCVKLAPPMEATTQTQKWICESCGFIYDPADGDPDGGIPPGTAFDAIPDDWFCPVCGARKKDFVPYDE